MAGTPGVFAKGKTQLDGLDLMDAYGLFIADRGYNSIVSYPPLKPVPFNDWPEENGIEVDLSNPVLDTRTVVIPFVSNNAYGLRTFYNVWKSGNYHMFNFNEIGCTNIELRMTGQQELKVIEGTNQWMFSLIFSDDFPLRNYIYQSPVGDESAANPEYLYYITDVSLSDYGIRILQGSNAEVLKMPQVKQKLMRKFIDKPGMADDYSNYGVIDTQYVVAQSKEVTLNCLMTSDSIPNFWKNYKSFLYDLKRPGPRYFRAINVLPFVNECFYKRSAVTEFGTFDMNVWCKFSLTLEFNNFAIDLMGY